MSLYDHEFQNKRKSWFLICSPTPSLSVSAEPQVPQQGKEATLRCEVNGPNPVTQVQWTKPDGSAHTEGPGSGSAHLKSVSSSDKGTWKCSFSFGGETYNQDLYVTVEGEHVTSARATIKKQTYAAPTASCDILYFGCQCLLLLQHHQQSAAEKQGAIISPAMKVRTHVIILACQLFEVILEWGIFCTVTCHYLCSLVVTVCFQPGGTVQPNHWSPMLLGLSWYLWVAIGVGCLFVVVLLILVICFFRRNRRKKVSKGNHLGESLRATL